MHAASSNNGYQFAVNNKLEVYIEPVQQEGEMDCGVFSIANAYNAAHAGEEYEKRNMTHNRCVHIIIQKPKNSTFPQAQNSTEINRCM